MTLKGQEVDLVIRNARQWVTCRGRDTHDAGIVEDRSLCLATRKDRIVFMGSFEELESEWDIKGAQILDAAGGVVAPGFIDCHTHLVFGGSRVREYTRKLMGEEESTIRAMGDEVGMAASVTMTRQATDAELLETARSRLQNMLAFGTTTVEAKTGYGLSTEHELRILDIMGNLRKIVPQDIQITFLGAHGWPADRTKAAYIDELLKEMLPRVASTGLATAADIWCDEGYYTAKECRHILTAAREHGLALKMHADAYSYIGGSDLAADMGMLSADHLNHTPLHVLKKLAREGVIGVLLPATDFTVKHERPAEPRAMLEAGMTIGLGTNCNPGNWIESMPLVMTLACRNHGLTPAEAMRAATIGSAAALGLERDRGSLEIGKRADLQIWKATTYEDLTFRIGSPLVAWVIKDGHVVLRSEQAVKG